MKKTPLILIAITIAVVIIIAISAVILLKSHHVPAVDTTNTFPASGTTQNNPAQPQGITLPVQGGGSVTTLDFIHNGVTIEDPANKGTYYLAGSSGACNPNGTCPKAGPSNPFNIVYNSDDNSFIIGITDEPLGQNRIAAEQYLMNALGITKNQMCALKYIIGTTSYVSPTYGGDNLGFSFCPNATPLP